MALLKRLLRALPLRLLSPFLMTISFAALILADVFSRRGTGLQPVQVSAGSPSPATVVTPNWNGRDLLEKYLPSVVTALSGNPANQNLVGDHGSTSSSNACL